MRFQAGRWIGLVIVIVLTVLAPVASFAQARTPEVIAVLGTGRVGAALGPRFAALGHEVVYGSREPSRTTVQALVARSGPRARATSYAQAVASASIVLIALPWNATEAALATLDLSGKLVIDPTNPMRLATSGFMEPVPLEVSAAERIQSLEPRARVVKAFNAVGAHVMADPAAGKGPVTVPVVGEDAAAKARVQELVRALGFETIDFGPLRHARQLEGLALLYMVPFMRGPREDVFEFYLRRGTAPTQSQGVRPAQ